MQNHAGPAYALCDGKTHNGRGLVRSQPQDFGSKLGPLAQSLIKRLASVSRRLFVCVRRQLHQSLCHANLTRNMQIALLCFQPMWKFVQIRGSRQLQQTSPNLAPLPIESAVGLLLLGWMWETTILPHGVTRCHKPNKSGPKKNTTNVGPPSYKLL